MHCPPVIKNFKVDYNGENVETQIKLVFSYVKQEERYREGKDFGKTSLGELYKKRNQKGGGYSNISIMRANREILSGHFGFISDISLPQHRMWSIEVHIEPVIDDIVGLDNKKQQASFIRFYEPDEADSEHPILVEISRLIAENIDSMFKEIKAQADGMRKRPPKSDDQIKDLPGSTSEKGTPSGEGVPEKRDQEIKDLESWISSRYGDELNEKQISSIARNTIEGKNNHIFVPSDLGSSTIYDFNKIGDKVLIEINQSSLLYDRVLQELQETNNVNGERAIYMLIGALVNAEHKNKTQDSNINNHMKRIRTEFGLSLDEYISAIYS